MNRTANVSIDPAIAAFFSDPAGSSIVSTKASQIVAPLVKGEDVKPEELMTGGGLRIVIFLLDRSYSMKDVGELLRKEFKSALVPAIKEGRENDIATLRIGGFSFSDDIIPIWVTKDVQGQNVYFHSLDELPDITLAEYDPSKGYGTNMDGAIEEGIATGMRYAADQQPKVGSPPDLDVFLLSDGQDTHRPDHSAIKAMIQSRNKGRVRFVAFYFETTRGMKNPKEELVEEYGYDDENVVVFKQQPGETAEQRAHRFRAMMRVMSRVSATKGTSAVQAAVAAGVVGTPGTGVEEEDLV